MNAALMSASAQLYELARADFLDRSRRYALFVTIALIIWYGSVLLPPFDSNYITIGFGATRGIYNSAWVGATFAVMAATLLSGPAFYLVKNSIRRDMTTGVGQILAGARITTRAYLIGKFFSNWLYLSTITIALAVAALCMQLVRAEVSHIDLWALWSPFLLITTPAFAMTAAFAIFFESIRVLRGSAGNILFFFVWSATLSPAIVAVSAESEFVRSIGDIYGANITLTSMADAARPTFGGADPMDHAHVGFSIQSDDKWKKDFKTFKWDGIHWTPTLLFTRVFWLFVALGLTSMGGMFFERFDTTKGRPSGARESSAQSRAMRGGFVSSAGTLLLSAPLVISGIAARWKFGAMIDAECRVALKGRNMWWYLFGGGMCVAQALVIDEVIRAALLGTGWLWMLPALSPGGNRERQFGVDTILWSAPHPLTRQLTASYFAGVLLTALAGAGAAIQFALSGDSSHLFAWWVGVFFIPALAIFCGVWSGVARLFEMLHVFLWYGAAMNRAPYIDYGGFSAAGMFMGLPKIFIAITIALLCGAYIGRMRQARR